MMLRMLNIGLYTLFRSFINFDVHKSLRCLWIGTNRKDSETFFRAIGTGCADNANRNDQPASRHKGQVDEGRPTLAILASY